LIYVVCRIKKIKVAVSIVETATKFTTEVKKSLLFPLGLFFVYFLFLIFWFVGLIYTYSAGSVKTPDEV
jgi:hypothetical protein